MAAFREKDATTGGGIVNLQILLHKRTNILPTSANFQIKHALPSKLKTHESLSGRGGYSSVWGAYPFAASCLARRGEGVRQNPL